MAKLRLDKYLADMQIGTRSQVKEYVRKGRVKVDAVTVKLSDIKIDTEVNMVYVDGERVGYVEHEYYMLNKPAGVLSATMDKKVPTVVDLIDSARKDLFPVGRLDKDTEGLLIITNDGTLAHNLLSPKKHVAKTYLAHIEGKLPENAAFLFEEGLKIDEEFTAMPAVLEVLGPVEGDNSITSTLITVHEGKFHQVKRMFQAVGCEVVYLKRLQMGSLVLDDNLKTGEYRHLSAAEVQALRDCGGN